MDDNASMLCSYQLPSTLSRGMQATGSLVVGTITGLGRNWAAVCIYAAPADMGSVQGALYINLDNALWLGAVVIDTSNWNSPFGKGNKDDGEYAFC